jgi:hypothetical protein
MYIYSTFSIIVIKDPRLDAVGNGQCNLALMPNGGAKVGYSRCHESLGSGGT